MACALRERESLGSVLSETFGVAAMTIVNEALDELRDARAERDRLRQAVIDWMAAEGREGRLRLNCHAPMWLEYDTAEKKLEEARERHGI